MLALILAFEGAEIARGSLLDHLGEVADLLKRGRIGLLSDLDGTISEIVPQPNMASVSPQIRSSLRELHFRLALVAIVTGRLASQARDIVGIQELIYVGNHGLERMEKGRVSIVEEGRPFAHLLEKLMERVRERTRSEELTFEDKGSSFAVHYRLAENPAKARRLVVQAIRELAGHQVRLLAGKSVIDVLPPVNLNKGTAVMSLVNDFSLSGAILMGDDTTDVDSFRSARELPARQSFSNIAIAVVGPDSPPELEKDADFTLSSVSEVENFLAWLVEQTTPR